MVRVVLAALLSIALVVDVAQAQEATPPAPERIAAAFEAALDNHDPARAATFLAEDARALVPNPLQGRNAITQFLIGRYAADTTIEVTEYAANGPRVTWMTRVTNGLHLQFNWDEAVIVDSRIALWGERAVDQAVVVMPEFQPARTLGPYLTSLDDGVDVPGRAAGPVGPRLRWWLVLVGALSGVTGGVLFGVWRERYHPPRGRPTRQDGHLFRGL